MKATTKENLAIGGVGVGVLLASVTLPTLVNRSVSGPYQGDAYRITDIEPRTVFNQEIASKFGMLRFGKREVFSLDLDGVSSKVVVDPSAVPDTLKVGDCLKLEQVNFGGMGRGFVEVTKSSIVDEPKQDSEKKELEKLNNDLFWLINAG